MSQQVFTDSPSISSARTIKQGADLFFQAAIHYGYRYVLGNPGTTEAPFMDALARYPELRFLLFLQENSATGAADGIARMTGMPTLVNLHLGPGLSNGLSNIHNARRAQVPMVVTVGDHDTRHLLEDSPLASDIESIARAECKWVWTVQHPSELADVLYRATVSAITAPQGPVCIIMPTNMLTDSPVKADGSMPSIPELHIPSLNEAPVSAIEQAAKLLLSAQRPVLLVGDVQSAASDAIEIVAAYTGAKVVYEPFPRRFDGQRLAGSTLLPYFSEERRTLLSQADLLFLIGVNSFTTLFFYANDPMPILAPGTQVIHLSDDLGALGKNERGSFPLYGDVTSTLAHVASYVKQSSQQEEMHSTSTSQKAPSQHHHVVANTDGSTSPLQPAEFMQALRDIIPNDTILVDESITARQALIDYVLNTGAPVTSYLTVRGASIGGCLPTAVGAKIGAPQRPVIAVSGDGSAMYTIQALWTAAHYHLPILFVICNNASYDIIKLELLRLRGTLATSNPDSLDAVAGLGEPQLDFALMARGMGVRGWVIQNSAELQSSLAAAMALVEQGEPALVDVHLTALPVAALQSRNAAS